MGRFHLGPLKFPIFFAEQCCPSLIFLRHCDQPFDGSGMFHLTSDTTASIRMVQKSTFLSQHRSTFKSQPAPRN